MMQDRWPQAQQENGVIVDGVVLKGYKDEKGQFVDAVYVVDMLYASGMCPGGMFLSVVCQQMASHPDIQFRTSSSIV